MKRMLRTVPIAALVFAAFVPAAQADSSTPMSVAQAETASWASAAVASSEWTGAGASHCNEPLTGAPLPVCTPGVGVNGVLNMGPWSAQQATGAPDTYPRCGDINTAWAPKGNGADPESITLLYDPPVPNAKRVDIYETNIGGFVTRVDVLVEDGSPITVFTGPDNTPCPGVLSIPISPSLPVVGVSVHTSAAGWEQIDAVSVVS